MFSTLGPAPPRYDILLNPCDSVGCCVVARKQTPMAANAESRGVASVNPAQGQLTNHELPFLPPVLQNSMALTVLASADRV